MKFIHIADVHLFASPDKDKPWGEHRTQEIEETFDRVLKDCNEKDIDLLLIAGNLFDRSPSVDDLIFVDEKLSKLTKTRTVILSGPDDFIPVDSDSAAYKFNSRTVMLPPDRTTNAYLRGINTCVTGFSYGKAQYRERIIENIDPGREDAINILIASGGDKHHMPFKKDKLATKGYDYVAMGYIRRPVHILKNRMAYAGSPEPLGPKETGRHGYVIGEINNEGTKISWCPIAKRNYVDVSITMSPELSADEIVRNLENKMLKLGNENIYSITLRGFSKDNTNLDLSRINSRFNIYEYLNMTISDEDEKILRVENENNMMGSFIREVNESYTLNESVRSRALRYGMEALILAGEER
ncbi:DNA repair exonuclease SbcCD nuclease subunit [Lachnospiraceae bacterium]|nr:DNA repair exonuclease SbcCD nuclease subunit [Lachnospiraceae bacterium]